METLWPRRRWTALSLFLAVVMGGCAQPSLPPPAIADLLQGAPFAEQAVPTGAALFALSPAMQAFVQDQVRPAARRHGAQLGLYRSLVDGDRLRIDYDAGQTRTAAETFEARAGNCLSLVMMTAALARELGIGYSFQEVEIPEIWTLGEQLIMLNGHVNLSLDVAPLGQRSHAMGRYTIDFQPVEDPSLSRVKPLSEGVVVAMFHNNRAVELMERGEAGAAYAHLVAALRAAPQHLNTLNTLAVLLRRAGDPARAERSLQMLLAREPHNRQAAANLATLWREQGRFAEAQSLEQSLPPSPFADFSRGLRLAEAGQWTDALQAFERQLRRSPDFHGLQFQLARVHYQLGHLREARRHLERAQEQAPTSALRTRYQTKVQALRRAS